MANFDTDRFGPEKMSSSFKPRTKEWCPRCDDYGKIVLPIYIDMQDGGAKHFICWKLICYLCKSQTGKRGSLYTLFTGTPSAPNSNVRYIKLPQGITIEDIQRTSETEPLRSFFTKGELLASRSNMF